MPTRRQFVKVTAAVALGAAGGALQPPRGAAAEPAANIKSRPDVIVYRGGYPGWPWVTRIGPQRLMCVFRDDSVHDFSPTGRVLWTASEDDGRTWTPAQVVCDEPDVDDRNAAVAALPDGTLMVCYNTYTKQRVSRSLVTLSRDRGATWSRPTLIADLDARTRAAPLPLASGEILIPFYRAPGNGSLAALSGDGGKQWTVHAVPDPPGFLGDEWSVLEVEKNRIVGIIRNSGAHDGYFWKTESRDGGRRWDPPVKTNVRDARSTSPAHLDWHGRTPVLTYADRGWFRVAGDDGGPCVLPVGRRAPRAGLPVPARRGADRRRQLSRVRRRRAPSAIDRRL